MKTFKSHFCRINVIILSLCMQHCYGRHDVSRKSITTSGLSILLHGVISLTDETSYDIVHSLYNAMFGVHRNGQHYK